MKRKVISVLALTLIVLMSAVLVSCDGWKQVASEETVEIVVDETLRTIRDDFYPSAKELGMGAEVSYVKLELHNILYNEYHDVMDDIDVDATANSITANLIDEDGGINKLDVTVTGITYSAVGGKTSADFTLSAAGYFRGAHATMDLKGNFTIGTSDKTITFTSTVFNGIDYDLAAFNNKMKEVFH